MMLQKPKSRKTAILKYGLSAPLFLIAMVLSSATISENKTIKQIENQIQPAQPLAEIMLPKVVEDLIINNKKEKAIFEKPVVNVNIDGEFEAFKKHLVKSLSFPQKLKEYGMDLKIAHTFIVNKSGIIEGVKQVSFLDGAKIVFDEDLFAEAATKIGSFKDKINVAEGIYTLFVNYKLEGGNKKSAAVDATRTIGVVKNFIGEITVTGYGYTNLALNEVTVVGYGTKTNEEPVFTNVEVLPGFPGGLESFGKFLGSNLRYPAYAKENNVQGRVFLSFVVEKDGALSNIKVARGIGSGCDEEAVRVLSISPKWTSGMQNGKTVRVSFTIPIYFKLAGVLPKNFLPEPPPGQKNPSADALYIIDGIEYEGSKTDLSSIILPSQIENMSILKDESAIKAYGEKGKNGVVIITTKKK